MRRIFLASPLAIAMTAQIVAAQEVTLPSGLTVTYLDRIVERQATGETWLTLRFVTPRIDRRSGDLGYEDVALDLDRLCDSEGLNAVAETGAVDQVMIALMDRALERGATDPDATMFIGAYLPTTEGCVWQ
ncbi:DUF6497 family protein [Tropicimonas marinistellae]|uniref:DUF6497 family protein n=1 Tax=Tropicimonas marinistellae TaxID=1739787 RepID=UPI00082E3933|nr:DUF6497 family protein [Tropicimonas marinistellae]